MNDIIRLLPDSVANQIAAGEVIQRPASVIKELVENSVDAGATDIRIYVKDAGRTLIQVVDNGKGMSETDARMAFERHATSKISSAADLFTLRTMGFRGEALPSICAISQVELKTSVTPGEMGTRIVINASRVEIQEPCVCDRGTCISVRNLFFNVPARRKFLKSDNVELSNIMREFERLSLVNNGIRMFIDTGGRSLDLRAGNFKQRISDIWKNNLNMQLLPVDIDTSIVRISGFISRPEFARRRNPLQYLIVNGRNMRHPYFHKAIVACYDSLIAVDTQPNYFLKFEVDPDSIDVNIHPTKHEIKFENEQQIWPILQAAVKASLGKFSAVPSIDFNTEMVPVRPLEEGEMAEPPTIDVQPDYNPFAPSAVPSMSFRHTGRSVPASRTHFQADNWDSLYAGFMSESAPAADLGETVAVKGAGQQSLPDMEDAGLIAPICMQYARKYIVTTSREGLVVIDQYRAHLKILYEGYMSKVTTGGYVAQGVMFPETICLDPEQAVALDEIRGDMTRMGFRIEDVAPGRIRITSIPSLIRSQDVRDVVTGILDSVCDGSVNYGTGGEINSRSMTERMALVMARSGAVARGHRLSPEEMEHIVGELFSLPDPSLTPDGKRICHLFDENRLEHLFG